MTVLIVACGALLLLAVLFLLLPLRIRDDEDRLAQANLRWYAVRAAEIERDGDEALREDIQLRLIEDEGDTGGTEGDTEADTDKALTSAATNNRFPRWLLVPVLAAASIGIYVYLGAAQDVLITQRLQDFGSATSAEDVEQLMSEMEARSARRPDNLHYMALLGRYHMGREDFSSAQAVYERLLAQVPEDAQALAYAAQAEYLALGRQLTDRARLRAEQALAADPLQRTALSLLGMASYEQGEYRGAIAYWQRLLATEPPNSDGARMIAQVIGSARQAMSGETQPATPAPSADGGKGVTVNVALPEGANAAPSDTVFVLARNAQTGSRMPIAVARFTVADLPLSVRLDDSRSMAGQKLSETASVIVAVQVSPQGQPGEANASWLGQAGPLVPGETTDPVSITLSANNVGN